jgi:diadenylate cyclase
MTLFDRIQALQFTWRDAVDILVVALILYNILLLIRGTRAMQMSIGLLFLGATYFVARALDLIALEQVTETILFWLPFAIIILFQDEIRRALTAFGRTPLVSLVARRTPPPFEALVGAVTELASRNFGALIAIERSQSLRVFAESGRKLDALLSEPLLVSIFSPNTPLHDGAVIIQGDRITAAGTFLPLTTDPDLASNLGTRHRAALGMSQETDALVLVVSEENSAISAALEGRLYENLSAVTLREMLERHLGAPQRDTDADTVASA